MPDFNENYIPIPFSTFTELESSSINGIAGHYSKLLCRFSNMELGEVVPILEGQLSDCVSNLQSVLSTLALLWVFRGRKEDIHDILACYFTIPHSFVTQLVQRLWTKACTGEYPTFRAAAEKNQILVLIKGERANAYLVDLLLLNSIYHLAPKLVGSEVQRVLNGTIATYSRTAQTWYTHNDATTGDGINLLLYVNFFTEFIALDSDDAMEQLLCLEKHGFAIIVTSPNPSSLRTLLRHSYYHHITMASLDRFRTLISDIHGFFEVAPDLDVKGFSKQVLLIIRTWVHAEAEDIPAMLLVRDSITSEVVRMSGIKVFPVLLFLECLASACDDICTLEQACIPTLRKVIIADKSSALQAMLHDTRRLEAYLVFLDDLRTYLPVADIKPLTRNSHRLASHSQRQSFLEQLGFSPGDVFELHHESFEGLAERDWPLVPKFFAADSVFAAWRRSIHNAYTHQVTYGTATHTGNETAVKLRSLQCITAVFNGYQPLIDLIWRDAGIEALQLFANGDVPGCQKATKRAWDLVSEIFEATVRNPIHGDVEKDSLYYSVEQICLDAAAQIVFKVPDGKRRHSTGNMPGEPMEGTCHVTRGRTTSLFRSLPLVSRSTGIGSILANRQSMHKTSSYNLLLMSDVYWPQMVGGLSSDMPLDVSCGPGTQKETQKEWKVPTTSVLWPTLKSAIESYRQSTRNLKHFLVLSSLSSVTLDLAISNRQVPLTLTVSLIEGAIILLLVQCDSIDEISKGGLPISQVAEFLEAPESLVRHHVSRMVASGYCSVRNPSSRDFIVDLEISEDCIKSPDHLELKKRMTGLIPCQSMIQPVDPSQMVQPHIACPMANSIINTLRLLPAESSNSIRLDEAFDRLSHPKLRGMTPYKLFETTRSALPAHDIDWHSFTGALNHLIKSCYITNRGGLYDISTTPCDFTVSGLCNT